MTDLTWFQLVVKTHFILYILVKYLFGTCNYSTVTSLQHTIWFAGGKGKLIRIGKGRTGQEGQHQDQTDALPSPQTTHIQPYPHPHPNPLPTHSLSPLPLSFSHHLPRTIALHSALTPFVALPDPDPDPDPHDHQSLSIPTWWNSLNSTLPYPSHHPIRPSPPSCFPNNTQAFYGLAIAPIGIQPGPEPRQTIQSPLRQPPNVKSTAQPSPAQPIIAHSAQLSSTRIASSGLILFPSYSLCCRDKDKR